MTLLIDIKHPDYLSESIDFLKWRYTYYGGRKFIDAYLKKLSSRESEDDYLIRRDIAYNIGYASSAVNDIKNAIYQRTTDVKRIGGPPSYQEAIKTYVDLEGNNINSFIGMMVLEEMLIMRKVGVLIDMPSNLGETVLDKGSKRPYLGLYTTENIESWSYKSSSNEKYLTSVKLCEQIEVYDENSGLTSGYKSRYRYMRLLDEGVLVRFYEENIDQNGDRYENVTKEVILNLPRIPFVIFEIPSSLLTNVADIQIALLNMESSDISFARKANFPLFYEFFDPKQEQQYKKPIGPPGVSDGTNKTQNTAKEKEVAVGLSKGRRYPIGLEAPGYVAPNPDTLRVSMEKGKQLRDDIYKTVNLTVSNLSSSADSKVQDQGTLENGLSFIGLTLQRGETEIGRHWSHFEGSTNYPKIVYPDNYSLETEEERRKKADHLEKMATKIVSDSYRRTVSKRIAKITVGSFISNEELDKIYKEIDTAPTLTSDPDQIIADHEAGLVSDQTASFARGYKREEVEKARKDRAERIRLTLEAQGGPQGVGDGIARGAPEFGGKDGSEEKIGKKKRGTADKVIKEDKDE